MTSAGLRQPFLLTTLFIAFSWSVWAQGEDNLVQKALDHPDFNWKSSGSNAIRIYYQPDSFAGRHRSMLLRSATTAANEVLESLGESEHKRPLRIFYLESREEMEQIVGRPVTGLANWSADGIFLVVNSEWRSFEKHEMAHIVTMGTWGRPDASSRWMIEGIAVYTDGWCREYTVNEVAYQLLSNKELPPLKKFLESFAELGEIRAGFYGASLIGFVRDTYGPEAMREIWLEGSERLTELSGANLDDIEGAWKEYLESTVRQETQVDLEMIDSAGCG